MMCFSRWAFCELVEIFFEMQADFGASIQTLGRFDGELARAFGLPPPAGGFLIASGEDFHAVGQHERRVKPDAELPDQRQVGFFVAGEFLQKLERPAMGDRAQVFDQLIVGQADAGIFDGENALVFVGDEGDFQRGVIAVFFVGQLQIPHLVQGIRGVGDQFADRDLFVLIQRMRQQMQQLLNFGLKRELLLVVGFRHVGSFNFLSLGFRFAHCGPKQGRFGCCFPVYNTCCTKQLIGVPSRI